MEGYYDDELLEYRTTLAESFRARKDLIKLAGKYVAIPTGVFVLTCALNYWIDKKIGSL